MNFVYQSFSNKVYFGDGQVNNISDIARELNGTRLFVVAGSRHQPIIQALKNSFGDRNICHFTNIVQHVPRLIVDEALELAHHHGSDLLIAIGGGSAIGLAKAVALQTRLRIVAVPSPIPVPR